MASTQCGSGRKFKLEPPRPCIGKMVEISLSDDDITIKEALRGAAKDSNCHALKVLGSLNSLGQEMAAHICDLLAKEKDGGWKVTLALCVSGPESASIMAAALSSNKIYSIKLTDVCPV